MSKGVRKFKFDKLVRDKIVSSMIKSGDTPTYYTLDNEKYVEELKKKLLEEVVKIPNEKDTEALLKELSDTQEVIDYLVKALGSSKRYIAILQKKKNAKAGSFKKKLFIEHIEVGEESEWVDYLLSNPSKYPEITDNKDK